MPFEPFDTNAVCPKCAGAQTAAIYTKGTTYGDPCEWAPLEDRGREHLHRCCQRCGYMWCQECAVPTGETRELEPERDGFDERSDAMLSRLDDLRKLAADLTSDDLKFWLEQAVTARWLLRTRYAPFKVGNHVRLSKTPVITEEIAPGWLGSKHFLVAGAHGIVRTVDVSTKGLRFGVVFFDESWIDRDGVKHPVPVQDRHVYSFQETDLEAETP